MEIKKVYIDCLRGNCSGGRLSCPDRLSTGQYLCHQTPRTHLLRSMIMRSLVRAGTGRGCEAADEAALVLSIRFYAGMKGMAALEASDVQTVGSPLGTADEFSSALLICVSRLSTRGTNGLIAASTAVVRIDRVGELSWGSVSCVIDVRTRRTITRSCIGRGGWT